MRPAIKFLLSDDNVKLHQPLQELAYQEGVDLLCFESWEEAKVALDEGFGSYDALILDGKGKIEDSSKEADAKHVTKAIEWLTEQKVTGRYIPVVIFTGFHDEITSFQGTNSLVKKIFRKGENVSSSFAEVLGFLKNAVQDSPRQMFVNAFPEVYQFSKDFFTPSNQELLLSLFRLINSKADNFTWKKNTLDYLRLLNEALVDTIPYHYYGAPFTVREYIDKIRREGNPRANAGNRTVSITDYFNHNETTRIPSPITNTIKNIYHTVSSYASHNNDDDTDYYPSTEIILGLTYAHLGCYHWFNQILNK